MSNRRSTQVMRNPELLQRTREVYGDYKGIVEDVRDPLHHGRVRVRVYAIHGDYENVATDALPWAEAKMAMRNSYAPPELFDRVWVRFEGGDVQRPIWDGYWTASPDGSGKLPFNRHKGLEVPRENWNYHPDHHPTSMSLFKTGEGDQLWVEDRPYGDQMVSSVNLADAGNKLFKISSKNAGKDYRPEGETIKGEWTDGNNRRTRPSESKGSITREGELKLDTGGFKLHNVNDGGGRADVTLTLNGSKGVSAIEMIDGQHMTQSMSQGNKINRAVLSQQNYTIHSQGKLIMIGQQMGLPEPW